MKQLYLECNMGAAGDMLNAAFFDICTEKQQEGYLETMNRLSDHIRVTMEKVTNSSICGNHMHVLVQTAEGEREEGHDHRVIAHTHGDHANVEHIHTHENHTHEEHTHAHEDHDHAHGEHHHEHHSMADIHHLVDSFPVSEQVKADVKAVYRELAAAESKAHGKPVEEIHFHEVGSMDAVADITGACLLLEMLHPDEIIVSPVNVGSGHVHTAHGVLPVPAPATATLLTGIPSYMSDIRGELCTPTGAALLKHFATRFGQMPQMMVSKIGYGMGTKEFPRLNCVRAFLGESAAYSETAPNDKVAQLTANLDDMTGEELGYCMERLLEAGALDVFAIPMYMKKSRPAYELNCLCKPEEADRIAHAILQYTSTFGVRRADMDRYRMDIHFEKIETENGTFRKKIGTGYGITKSKLEYADVAEAAARESLPLRGITISNP